MGVKIVTWIHNWLTDRKQRVSVEGETAARTAVHSGVPQGSVQGATTLPHLYKLLRRRGS